MAMSNLRMFRLARDYKALDIDEKAIAVDRGKIKGKITAEMIRRGDRKLESTDGVAITLTQGSRVVYHEDEIQDSLTVSQWNKATTRRLDFGKLTEMIQSGELDSDFLADHSHVEQNAPYPTITIKE